MARQPKKQNGQAEHPRHLGRRHRPVEPELLHARADGLPDAQHRPHRQGRHAVHRLLRRAVLHRRPLVLHHRAERLPHRPLEGRHPGRAGRHVRQDRHHRGAAQGPGLRHRAVRQEPPRRPEPHAADQPRLRRVLRQPLPPQRRGRAGDVRLSVREGLPGLQEEVRAARRDPLLGDRQGRPDGDAALGQGRQAEDRGHRARSTGSAWRPATTSSSPRPRTSSSAQNEAGKPFFVWLNTTHMHLFTHTKKESLGQAGPLAVALPRHHGRPRQERRPDARPPRRARHRRRHLRACTPPTTARTATPGPMAA